MVTGGLAEQAIPVVCNKVRLRQVQGAKAPTELGVGTQPWRPAFAFPSMAKCLYLYDASLQPTRRRLLQFALARLNV